MFFTEEKKLKHKHISMSVLFYRGKKQVQIELKKSFKKYI